MYRNAVEIKATGELLLKENIHWSTLPKISTTSACKLIENLIIWCKSSMPDHTFQFESELLAGN